MTLVAPINPLGDDPMEFDRDEFVALALSHLRQTPTPISGGMRKALAKERGQQDALRWRPRRNWFGRDQQQAFGMIMVGCPRCRRAMFYDEIEDDAALPGRMMRRVKFVPHETSLGEGFINHKRATVALRIWRSPCPLSK